MKPREDGRIHMSTAPRVSTLVPFINIGSPVVKGLYIKCVNEYVPVLLVINLTHLYNSNKRDSISTFDTPNIFLNTYEKWSHL